MTALAAAMAFAFAPPPPAPAGSGLDRAALAAMIRPPYSLGQIDADQPLWPVYVRQGGRDRLVAYVADITPTTGGPRHPVHHLVAMDAEGTVLAIREVGAPRPAWANWLESRPPSLFPLGDRP
jgi:hypothetical protein